MNTEDLPGANASAAVSTTHIDSLPLVHRGKVRDSYAVGDDKLLIIASDRLSAYDVVLPDPVPGKGIVLTALSNFWFARTRAIARNHLTTLAVRDVLSDPDEVAQAEGRGVVVQRLRPLPIEAVVRGYLIGSGYKDYLATGAVCGIELPAGLQLAQKLDAPLFTPATKAAAGDHDENIDFATVCATLGEARAVEVRDVALRLFDFAVTHAAARGILIADTKFEFGLDEDDRLVLMDEVLTSDSSRFWPAADYTVGTSPKSYDKQFVRDYLETLDWDKTAPGPRVPQDVIAKTRDRYVEAWRVLTGEPLSPSPSGQ